MVTLPLAWPKSICRRIADGGSACRVSYTRCNGRVQWLYNGKHVCYTKARRIQGVDMEVHRSA